MERGVIEGYCRAIISLLTERLSTTTRDIGPLDLPKEAPATITLASVPPDYRCIFLKSDLPGPISG
ncbi:hypothetical protein FF011L_46890 [Roseimaritima multifibrata]|uniref:Uncharacterized protein n=1 Tax=Roseimaritima multifibrata TaxID=1930274 RepID=A0A517MLW4_9BACT|nr:hypothetical protein FF011L_46890 [Roseimaritima multifibrata]